MSSSTPAGGAVPTLRRNIHIHLQLLILPPIIVLLLSALLMKGCAGAERPATVSPGMLSFSVEGMGCPNCASELAELIRTVPGVADAKVGFEERRAFVTLDKDHPATLESIMAVVEKRQEEHLKSESDPNCTKPKH